MKNADTHLPDGVLGLRQPCSRIDHVEQGQELSGSNDVMIEIAESVELPAQQHGGPVLEKRT